MAHPTVLANNEPPEFWKTALSFSAPFSILTFVLLWVFFQADNVYQSLLTDEHLVAVYFRNELLPGWVATFAQVSLLAAVAALAGAIVPWTRKKWTLEAIRKLFLACYVPAILLFGVVIYGTSLMTLYELEYCGEEANTVSVFFWRWSWIWPIALFVLVAGFLHITSWRRYVIEAYQEMVIGADDDGFATGDRVLENLRTHGIRIDTQEGQEAVSRGTGDDLYLANLLQTSESGDQVLIPPIPVIRASSEEPVAVHLCGLTKMR